MIGNITILHTRPAIGETIAWCLQFASPYQASYMPSAGDLILTEHNRILILSDPLSFLSFSKSGYKPECPVLLMIDDFGDKHLHEALNVGVGGLTDLTKGPEVLIRKVQHFLEYNSDDEDDLFHLLIHRKALKRQEDNNHYHLTLKEKHILKQLREGVHLKMVAHNTGTSYETVRTHVKHIYRKLGVMSASEAVIKAIKMDLD